MDEEEVGPYARIQELTRAAMRQVRALAPPLAESPSGSAQRGIDVALRSDYEAERVADRVKSWLVVERLDERVQSWVWSGGSSGGDALTASGRTVGRELRLSRRSTS